MVPVVFMGSPPAAVPSLRALAEAAPRHGARVAAVFSQPDRPVGRHRTPQPCAVKSAAEALGIAVHTPVLLQGPAGERALRDARPALVIVCAYGHILPRALLELPPLGCYNLHFSLLPRWRGASPVQAAILAGDGQTGVSLQRMAVELDAGEIAARSAPVTIAPDDTAESLALRLADVAASLVAEALPRLLARELPLTPQDPAGVTLCRTLRKEDGAVDWEAETAAAIERKVRAYTPWPGCHGFLAGKRLGLVRVALAPPPPQAAGAPPGTILPGGVVATRAGGLRLLEVKPEGKGAMPWAAFVNGTPAAIGARLAAAPESPR
jgi:methionyl-tRNA formyltransferase